MKKRYLFMMFGYVGAGKSFVARWLAPHMHAVHLKADDLRWAMFGEDRPELYTPANKALVNNALNYASRQILQAGVVSVLQDAHHNQRAVRQKVAALAHEYGAVPVIVWVQTDEAMAKQRIQSRARTEGHVIFDPDIINTMRRTTDALAPDESVIVIDGLQTAAEQQESFDRQLAVLQDLRA